MLKKDLADLKQYGEDAAVKQLKIAELECCNCACISIADRSIITVLCVAAFPFNIQIMASITAETTPTAKRALPAIVKYNIECGDLQNAYDILYNRINEYKNLKSDAVRAERIPIIQIFNHRLIG